MMTKVEQLEREVRGLSMEDRTTFRAWFVAFDAMEWDEQIERDVMAGRLDRLAADAIAEHQAGHSRPV